VEQIGPRTVYMLNPYRHPPQRCYTQKYCLLCHFRVQIHPPNDAPLCSVRPRRMSGLSQWGSQQRELQFHSWKMVVNEYSPEAAPPGRNFCGTRLCLNARTRIANCSLVFVVLTRLYQLRRLFSIHWWITAREVQQIYDPEVFWVPVATFACFTFISLIGEYRSFISQCSYHC
jgi:hypothetical protein